MLSLDLHEKTYGHAIILSEISLRVKAGERVAILGPSGIGKTTLLRILAGLDTAFSGTLSKPENTTLMFQNPNLLPWRTIEQNLEIFHPSLALYKIKAALDEIGLSQKAALYPNQLSLGQQRRLALIRSFLGRPDLILLDEPFVSLDQELKAQMLALASSKFEAEKAALVLVTHSREEAEALDCQLYELKGAPARLIEI